MYMYMHVYTGIYMQIHLYPSMYIYRPFMAQASSTLAQALLRTVTYSLALLLTIGSPLLSLILAALLALVMRRQVDNEPVADLPRLTWQQHC